HRPGFCHGDGSHSLPVSAVAVASCAMLANHAPHVLITGGDGDVYGIGLNHCIHAMRRNLDLTYIVMNNQVYGLTTGQASPTTEKSHKNKSTPPANGERTVKP